MSCFEGKNSSFRGKIDEIRVFDRGIFAESKGLVGFVLISCPPRVVEGGCEARVGVISEGRSEKRVRSGSTEELAARRRSSDDMNVTFGFDQDLAEVGSAIAFG
jgi:hypothetical protein